MAKYFRVKADGYVMNFNEQLAAFTPGDVFESDTPPPEFIEDLPGYMAGQIVDSETAAQRVRKSKKEEPVFLKTADGAVAA